MDIGERVECVGSIISTLPILNFSMVGISYHSMVWNEERR